MSFTPEELAEMARADAEIEREFILTAEEAAESRKLDRDALMARKDKQAKAMAERNRRYREANKEAVAECQRRYYEANKAKWADYNARQKAKKAALLRQQEDGQPEGPATNTSQV
jgi:hypothetical protein